MSNGISVRRYWQDVVVGEQLPGFGLLMSTRKVSQQPSAVLDFFPGHFDPEYARSIGQPAIFSNTMPLAGLFDRLATDWSGPHGFVVKHRLELIRSVYAGDQISVHGHVAATRPYPHGPGGIADIEAEIVDEHGELRCRGGVSVRLPAR